MALTGISVLTLVAAVLLQQPGGTFCFNNALRRNTASFFDGHDFWDQFNHGFRELEHALNRETEWVDEEMTKLTSLNKQDREPLGDDSDEDDEMTTFLDTSDQGVNFGFPGYLFNFGGAPRKPWWKGPNVCVEREEIDESPKLNETDSETISDDGVTGTYQFSSCQQTNTKYICTTKVGHHGIRKTFVVKYQCCHGYLRVADKPGCTEVHLKNLLVTSEEVGAKDFVELIRTSGLEQKITTENLTLFVPNDDAVRDFTDSLQEANQVEFYVPPASARRRRSTEMQGVSMRDIVLGHMVPDFYDLTEMSNEQIVKSENGKSPIRLNIYPGPYERLITANCARVTSINNHATNGIVHVVDRVIRPVSKSIAEVIGLDEQFGVMRELLVKAGLMQQLEGAGHFTLFVPPDAAFDRLDGTLMSRLMQGDGCLKNVLKHHMLFQTLCSAAIHARAMVHNMDGETLQLDRNPDNNFFVGGVRIVTQDILATNGIIHVIEEVLIPDSARPMTGVLAAHNLTKFLTLIKEAGLSESLDSMSNVTLFAPTDGALAKSDAAKALVEVQGDKDKLRDLLLFHITGPEVRSCDFDDEQMLKSGLADKSIRINLFSQMPFFEPPNAPATAQCARIYSYDNRACGGVVHVVDRLLVPPTQTVLDMIEKGENYTLLRKMIKGTGLEESLAEKGPLTFLAITDATFHKLDEEDVQLLLEDKQMAKRILQQHVLPGAACCAAMGQSTWPFAFRIGTLAGAKVAARKDHEGRVHFGSTTVLDCDIPALNGIVHNVNRIMLPHIPRRNGMQHFGNPNVEVFIYGL